MTEEDKCQTLMDTLSQPCPQHIALDSLWVTVDLLQVLGQAGGRSRDGGRWQKVPFLQKVDHSQGFRDAGLETHGRQRGAELGGAWTRRLRHRGGRGYQDSETHPRMMSTSALHTWNLSQQTKVTHTCWYRGD